MKQRPTDIFFALASVSPEMQLQLMALALSGDSPVSNAFTDLVDRGGLTPQARERKLREEQRAFAERMQAIQEQQTKFQEELNRMSQASYEALQENEELLASARDDLKRIRERAYEITMPDGSVARVYRDGDKVRSESGAEIAADIVRPSDLPPQASTWSDYKTATDRIERLKAERNDILRFREAEERTRERVDSSTLTSKEIEQAQRQLNESMPSSVRRHYEALSREPAGASAEIKNSDAPGMLAKDFTAAANHAPVTLKEEDFAAMPPRPGASAPAPR